MLILEYHGVSPLVTEDIDRWVAFDEKRYDLNRLRVSPSQFEAHLRYLLSRGYRHIPLGECAERYSQPLCSAERSFCITFDDGYADNYRHAFPILRHYGCTATVFLVVDRVEETSVDGGRIFLTWEEARAMGRFGIDFGSHTLTHPDLRRLSPENARREIGLSKATIEDRLGLPVRFFSYPYGFFNPGVQDMVRESGYSGAVVTPVEAGVEDGKFAMKRVGLYRHNSMLEFRWKIGRAFQLFREFRLLRGLHKAVNRMSSR